MRTPLARQFCLKVRAAICVENKNELQIFKRGIGISIKPLEFPLAHRFESTFIEPGRE